MAASECTIATRTPDLLHVILNGSRHIKMNDGLNVAFIDSHRKGNCATQHARLIVDELLLDVVSLLIGLTCMVGCRRDTVLVEIASDLVGCASLCCE